MIENKVDVSSVQSKSKNSIVIKMVVIGILSIALFIPATMVQSLISDREYNKENAISEVSSKWGEDQLITGPILTIPYANFFTEKDKDGNEKLVKSISFAHFLPDNISIKGEMSPKILKRGIYDIVVYNAKMNILGDFPVPDFKDWKIKNEDIFYDQAFISIGISDMKGIQNSVNINWNGAELPLNPGIDNKDLLDTGISTKIPLNINSDSKYNFSFDLDLNGSGVMDFIPVGKETSVSLKSSWQTPSFDGSFLPDKRNIDESGFQADWNILHLNRNYPQRWTGAKYSVKESAFGVNLLLPVDHYQKSMRSAKYSIMIIILTFLIFFFSEVLNNKKIHPIQYILVGLAITLFYSLLLSLSEHIGFNNSYIVSSIATILLISTYSYSFLKSMKLTLITASITFLLYAFVFVTIQLEDYALLLGSIGLFVVLSIVMYLSRKIDWYQNQ